MFSSGKSICGTAARRALRSWPQDGRRAIVHGSAHWHLRRCLRPVPIFTFVPRPSIRDPWPLDVSSLEHTLAPTPPPLPFGSCFCFFSQSALVRCSAGTSRCPPIRDRQDEGSTPSSWCRVQATDLTRVKATGSSSPRSPSCTQPSDNGFPKKNMKERTPKS